MPFQQLILKLANRSIYLYFKKEISLTFKNQASPSTMISIRSSREMLATRPFFPLLQQPTVDSQQTEMVLRICRQTLGELLKTQLLLEAIRQAPTHHGVGKMPLMCRKMRTSRLHLTAILRSLLPMLHFSGKRQARQTINPHFMRNSGNPFSNTGKLRPSISFNIKDAISLLQPTKVYSL